MEKNVAWLRERTAIACTWRSRTCATGTRCGRAVRSAEQVFHFAAQVAVTTSLTDPLHDFEVNVGGTLNLLEAIGAWRIRRRCCSLPLIKCTAGWRIWNWSRAALGISRWTPRCARESVRSRRLDFHSPYGCSKGAADQYVLDYARTFGLPAVVFRMSCIYGLHQMGTEDQGWVAHFLIRAIEGNRS